MTQNALAEYVRSQGHEPRSPTRDEPNFDLAWKAEGKLWVAEVKSLTPENEEKQLRLGLGQVLRFRHQLERGGVGPVTAVLVGERAPEDTSWASLCEQVGVILTWPGGFESRL